MRRDGRRRVGGAVAALLLTEVGEEGVEEHHHGRHQQHTGADGQHGRRVIVHLEHHGRVPVRVGHDPPHCTALAGFTIVWLGGQGGRWA